VSRYIHTRLIPHVAACAAAVAALGASGVAIASGHASEAGSAHASVGGAEEASSIGGIKLGEFRIRSYYLVEAQKSTVTFALYASAGKDQFQEAQQVAERRGQKVRDQVIIATRLVPLAELNDPELKSFRRRILLRLRRTLPELPIDDVYVTDFQLVVQSL
jgi:hypothetical protein